MFLFTPTSETISDKNYVNVFLSLIILKFDRKGQRKKV